MHGYGVQKNESKAIDYFEDAAKKGDEDGKMLFIYYLLQKATNEDNTEKYFEAFQFLMGLIV